MSPFRLGCLLSSGMASLVAQSFSYPDFANPAQLQMLGNASLVAGALRLVPNAPFQGGWAWRQTPVSLTFGFSTTFTFRIAPSAAGTRGEGLAFVLHGDPLGAQATGGAAWGLGYGSGSNAAIGIRRSLVVEIDTYRDVFLGDTSANEVSLHSAGVNGNSELESASLVRATPATLLADGLPHTLQIAYVPGLVEVFLDGASTPLLSRAWNHANGGTLASGGAVGGLGLANDQAWLGFCATTGSGGLTQLVEIASWSCVVDPGPDPCYQGTFPANLLTVQGQSGGATRTVRLGAGQSFAIGVGAPAGGSGLPYVLFASLAPQPGAFGTQLGFGQTCFPVLPASANELVVVDTFGVLPGLLGGAPAPYSIGLPPGLGLTPLDFTLQAVLASSLAPFTLGVTNAIDVEFRPVPAPTATGVVPTSAATGATCSISGSGFLPGLTLSVGSLSIAPIQVTPTQVTFAYPGGLACNSTMLVRNPDGQQATIGINPQAAITNMSVASGPAAGGSLVVLQGSGFAAGTTVTVGGAPANLLAVSTGVVVFNTPPGTPGPKPVVVTPPGGCAAQSTFTYL
ncbi:MAG: IPT/TIG domain-containing protein [Planctomycetes bacterium]|nr:IPT/TIG domain-containing protein [Planctomycetota bacterium]